MRVADELRGSFASFSAPRSAPPSASSCRGDRLQRARGGGNFLTIFSRLFFSIELFFAI
jgi:hypothetical protein